MHILFIAQSYGSLSIEYLSACLKQSGHKVSILFDPMLFEDGEIEVKFLAKFFSQKKNFIKNISKIKPDLIAFSVVTDHYPYIKKLSKTIKKEFNIPILYGGIHITSVPDIVIQEPHVDMICLGEGEEAIVDLANNFGKTNIKNIWFKLNGKIIKNPVRPLISNLDSIPFPDHKLFYDIFSGFKYGYGAITSRGCPFSCTYCNNTVLKKLYPKNYIRRRSVDNVIEELIHAKNAYQAKFIRFHDEIFTYDKKWLREFVEKYQKVNLPYFCWVHPNTVDEEVVRLLKKSGCYEAQMGVQTFDNDTRKKILHRHTTNEKIKTAINLFKKHKIRIVTDNIFGIPKQSYKELQHLLKFYALNLPSRIEIYYLRYYPKTDIINIAQNHNVLSTNDIKILEEGNSHTTFTMGGDTFNKKYSQLQMMFYLIGILPKKIRLFLIKNKIYRLFPQITPFYLRVVLRKFNKAKYDMFRNFMKKKYLHYSFRKILSIFSRT